MVDSFLFAFSHIIQDISKVKIQSDCIYHKLMSSFYIPFSFSYSYVPYSTSIYPVPRFCAASSGKIACFPKWISYIIAYYSQASHSYINIINHDRKWFWIYGITDRQPTLRSGEAFLHLHISQTNHLIGIVPWPYYFPPLRLTNG